MTKRIPCRLKWLLKILHLLPDLLQVGFAADHALRDYRIVRFCAECIEFAKNLLCDEFQCAPNRLLPTQMMRELRKVTLKSRQLLRYISAIGEESNFLQHAFVVAGERQPGFLYSVEQRGPIPFHHVRMQCPDFLEFFPNRF